MDKTVYETLVRRSKAILHKYPEVQYLLFSLSSYKEWLEQNVDKKNVALFTLVDLYE